MLLTLPYLQPSGAGWTGLDWETTKSEGFEAKLLRLWSRWSMTGDGHGLVEASKLLLYMESARTAEANR